MVDNITVTPNTKPRLAMLEPITLLKAKSGCPCNAAFKLTINSGADVAKETTVIPTTIFGICNLNENPMADFNNQFPPRINKKNPTIIKIKSI